jgi:putative flavoprotein involved in K+ transport
MNDMTTLPTTAAGLWLADFASALDSQDIDAAVALFAPESYWRDLVSFTWNMRTQEGPAAIREMLEARLADVKPTNFAIEGEPSESGGVTDKVPKMPSIRSTSSVAIRDFASARTLLVR